MGLVTCSVVGQDEAHGVIVIRQNLLTALGGSNEANSNIFE